MTTTQQTTGYAALEARAQANVIPAPTLEQRRVAAMREYAEALAARHAARF